MNFESTAAPELDVPGEAMIDKNFWDFSNGIDWVS